MREFHELFAGRDDVYGTYDLSAAPLPGEKRGGQARTVHGPVDKELYDAHLNGEQSIGIVPIMKDDTCLWFAIDVDSYDGVHKKLARRVELLGLPLLVCNTKSGGAHLYCFLKKPISAKIARDTARRMISALSLPETTEIFPKQDHTDGTGNWINLPYFGQSRQFMGVDGEQELSLREFLSAATHKSIWPDDPIFRAQEAKEVLQEESVPSDHSQAPPCIQDMFRFGVKEGSRNNCLMHIGVYMKRAFPDDWDDRIAQVNHGGMFDEPLKFSEVGALVGSLRKTDYQYKCHDQPMESMCNAALCKRMRFGIGEVNDTDAKLNWRIDSLRQIGDREPVYVAMVNGKEVKLTPDQLTSFALFRKAVMIKLRIMPTPVKAGEFFEIISNVMQTMEYEDAPDAVNSDTQLINAFKDWVEEMMEDDGGSILSLANGSPYYDFDQKKVIFRPDDFFNHLRRKTFERIDRNKAWVIFNSYGAQDRKTAWAFPANPPWFDVKRRTTI